jgi:peptidoglycan/LPS O-acetylase OafA/YrhL
VSPIEHLPVGALVVSFLAGVSLHLYRDTIPCSRALGVAAGVVAAVLLQFPNTCYLAAFPVAYLTVWLGLMRPPKIPFGDLSYGVYLFHFPIEQSVMQVFPGVGCWWQLTLIALPPSALCAWLSWNLVEHPVLTRKKDVLAAVDRAYAALARQMRPALTPGERAR